MTEIADEIVRQANSEFAKGQKEVAIRKYHQALDADPDHVEARFQLANVHTSLGDLESALQFLDHLLADQPKLAPAHFNRGNVLFFDGQFVDAAEAYRTGLALAPNAVAFFPCGLAGRDRASRSGLATSSSEGLVCSNEALIS